MPYPGPYHGGPWVNEVRDPDGNIVIPSTTPEVAEALDWWDESIGDAWRIAEAGGIEWQDTITAAQPLVLGRGYPVNATNGPVSLTLPTPAAGRQVAVQLTSPTSDTNVVTVAAGAGASILGSGQRTLKLAGTVEVLQAVSTTLWVVRSTGVPASTLETHFAEAGDLAGKSNVGHTHPISAVSGLRDELDDLGAATGAAPPVFAAHLSADQSIPSGGVAPFSAINFPTAGEELDSAGAHGSTNSSRWTCQRAGIYQPLGLVTTVGSTAGKRAAAISKNGTVIPATQVVVAASSGGDTGVVTKPHPVACNQGDYLELRAYQDSGAARMAIADFTSFAVTFLRDPV